MSARKEVVEVRRWKKIVKYLNSQGGVIDSGMREGHECRVFAIAVLAPLSRGCYYEPPRLRKNMLRKHISCVNQTTVLWRAIDEEVWNVVGAVESRYL